MAPRGVRVAPVGKVASKPPQPSFEQAAVLSYPTFVTMQALHDHGHVQPALSARPQSSSRSRSGATVTGVCSGGQADLVRSLGANEVIDYTRGDFTDGSRRFDLTIDIGGRTSTARLRRALTGTGTLVTVGGEGDRWIGGIHRQMWATVLV